MSVLADFVAGARPKTLPAAAVPVIVGTAVAGAAHKVNFPNVILAFVVALTVQVGTNYANDYSDGIRGTDEVRVGPARLVAGGIAKPKVVKRAALAAFSITAIAGLVLSLRTSPWLILVGALSIAAGWLYTGGPKPYGYLGLGEIFVFIFFGLTAVVGTAYVAADQFLPLSLLASVPVGLLAVDLLMINNIRDIPTDTISHKNTLAVLMGDTKSRYFYVSALVIAEAVAAAIGAVRIYALIVLFAVPLLFSPIRKVLSGTQGRDLIPVLAKTGLLQLTVGILLAIGIWL